MSFLRTAAAWLLDPAKRKAFYGALAAAGTLLVLTGVATDSVVTSWVGVVVAGLDLVALGLGMVKARRVNIKALYLGFAAVIVALKSTGALTDDAGQHVLDLAAAAVSIASSGLLFFRTDLSTPTAEPSREYNARHGAPPAAGA